MERADFLNDAACSHGSMGLLLLEGQAIQEPLQLTSTDGECLRVHWLGPAEATALPASIIEPKAIGIPDEDLELVAAAIAEDEAAVTEEIEFQDLADACRQTVDGLSQIGAATGQIDLSAFAQA